MSEIPPEDQSAPPADAAIPESSVSSPVGNSPADQPVRGWLVGALIVLVGVLLYRSIEGRLLGSAVRTVTPRGDLAEDEKSTIEVFESASPSVVYVNTVRSVRGQREATGTGSGFVWDEAGYIVTNFHVIQQLAELPGTEVVVSLNSGLQQPAELVGIDASHDLAVLRIQPPPEGLIAIQLGTSSDLQIGQKTFAIGAPFGFSSTLTTGVLSGLGREMTAPSKRKIYGMIQTDAAINPGNSGGPLLDSAGRLIGVNTQIYSPSGAYAGLGFAVPVDTVRRFVPQLIEHGRVKTPGMGIVLVPEYYMDRARRFGKVKVDCVAIEDVENPSAAYSAGLRRLDLIVGIDDTPIRNANDLHKFLDRKAVGDEISVSFVRDGDSRTTKLKLEQIGLY